MMKICLYGPPGSGKTTAGRGLAESLALPFYDLDQEIEARQQKTIPEIFASQGEGSFRTAEGAELKRILAQAGGCVLSLGAGALLDEHSRREAESAGRVICLGAAPQVLLARLQAQADTRPLLAGDVAGRLANLLAARSAHYASFPSQVDTSSLSPEETAWQVQVRAGCFRVKGMGRPYPVLVVQDELASLGNWLAQSGLKSPVAMVCDQNVARHYEQAVLDSLEQAGFTCRSLVLPPGEDSKTLAAVARLWDSFLAAGLDRKSTVLAVGGGVVTDLAGFAASTYLRGVRWAAVPSTLLGMVDASLGGKTGINLPQGKNLAGAFHAPSLVLAYPGLLATLPEAELRNGLAEVVKHGVISDSGLYQACARGWEARLTQSSQPDWEQLVSRAMAVKIRVLLEDPYEEGRREVLNFGHTVGHALEQASAYRLRHGEAIAIGMVVESQLGEILGVTEPGLAAALRTALTRLGLPTQVPPGLDLGLARRSLQVDKKNQGGKVRLALPVEIGNVQTGFEIEVEKLWPLFLSCMDPT